MQRDVPVVVAIVIRRDGRILMVRRRHPEGPLLWGFPGGKVHSFELEADASQREVREEAGVQCKPLRKLGERTHPDTFRQISYWLCEHTGGYANVREPDRIDSVTWMTPTEAKRCITSQLFPPVAKLFEDMEHRSARQIPQ